MTNTEKALELKPCPFCGGEAESDSQRGYRNMTTGRPEDAAAIYCTACSADMTWCYRDTPEIDRDQVMALLIEQWNARAASLQDEDAIERVARIMVRTDPNYIIYHMPGDTPRDWKATSGYRAKTSELSESAAEGVRARARAILALTPDEAAIRADEREKCAKVAESECYATTGRQIAAAIRSNGRGA